MAKHAHVVVSKRLVAINSASSLLAKIVNMTVLLWMYQYLLSRLSAAEFAVLPVVTSLIVFAPLFFSMFTSGISRFVVEAYAKGEFAKVTGIVSSIFPLLACSGVVFVAVGTVFALNIDKVLNIPLGSVDDSQIMMLLLVLNFTVQMLALPFLSGFHVQQRFVELNLIGILRDLLRICLLLVLLLGIGPQVIWVVVATVISETSYSVFTVLRARRILPQLRLDLSLFSWRQARQLTGFGLWTTLGRLGNMMYTNAATILLNIYGTPVDVTSYHIGATFFRQIDGTVGLAAQPLQPALTAMHALDDRKRLGNTVLRGGRYALWVTLLVATPLAFFADVFIGLYLPDGYDTASMVIVFFMVIFPFTAPTALLAMTAMATAHVRAFFLPAFLFQLAGMVLMVLALRYTDLGAIGVTLSLTAITVASQLLYYWPLATRIVQITPRQFMSSLLWPGVIPAIAAAAAALLLRLFALPDTWSELVLAGAVCVAVYAIALVSLALTGPERDAMFKLLAKVTRPGRKGRSDSKPNSP